MYRQHIENYLKTALGEVPLDRLTGEDIAVAYDLILREAKTGLTTVVALGPANLRRIHACRSSALGRAVKTAASRITLASGIDLPVAKRPLVHPWEPVELGRFRDHAVSHRLGFVYELIAATGLRRGEALGLRWSDVDVERGLLVVNQQLVDSGIGAPRSVRRRRQQVSTAGLS